MEDDGIFYGCLVHFSVFCYIFGHLVQFVVFGIFFRFGILYQEKSGNPGPAQNPNANIFIIEHMKNFANAVLATYLSSKHRKNQTMT
jgi:hypothetical protein